MIVSFGADPNLPLDLHMGSHEISTNGSQSNADIAPHVNQIDEDIAARGGATVNQASYNQMNWWTLPYYGFGGYFPVHSYAPGPPL